MTRATLDKLRVMGMNLGPQYDKLADTLEASRKSDSENITISRIEYKAIKSKDEINKYIEVKVTLSTEYYYNLVEIEIDGRIFQATRKSNTFEQQAFYANVFIDFSTIISNYETFTITAKLKNILTNSVTNTKYVSIEVNRNGDIGAKEEKVEDKENLINLSNFVSIFGNRKLFTHFKMKQYDKVYDIDKQIFINKLNDNLSNFEIDTLIRISHFFGQIEHESDHLNTIQEYSSGEKYNGREDLENTEVDDGPRFKGRGLIQLTGRENYRKFSLFYNSLTNEKINFTIEPNNELLVSNIDFAIKASCWFWQIYKGLNQYADEDDLIFLTYKINGGFNGYNDRKEKTIKSLLTLKVIENENSTKELGVYNVVDSKLFGNFSGMYMWAKYFDKNYPDLKGTGKNKDEAKNAYQRVIDIFDNKKVKKQVLIQKYRYRRLSRTRFY